MIYLYPRDFNFVNGVKFLNNNYNFWVVMMLCYLPICQILEKLNYNFFPKFLRSISIIWNFSIALFSILGAINTLPFLVKCLYNEGISGTLLKNEETWEVCNYRLNSQFAFWSFLFAISKLPEFIDTFLYVLRNKRQHIFLHWYHHVVTALYSYMLVIQNPEPSRFGIWMVSINYFVHSFMYLYYGLTEFSNFKTSMIMKKFANFITTIQIGQMFLILYVIVFDYYILGNEFETFGFTMYLIYAILFLNLYMKKYSKKKE